MKQKNIPANYFYPGCIEEFIGRTVRALPGAQVRVCVSTNHKRVHILIKLIPVYYQRAFN